MLDIIIDTREQAPWAWPEHQASVRVHGLSAGDYALAQDCYELDGRRDTYGVRFAIERKSLDDFLCTISTGWERFGRELERMSQFPSRVVIVEGCFDQCCFGAGTNGELMQPQHSHARLLPQFVASRVAELTLMGVSVLFAGDAGLAAGLAYRIFTRRDYLCKSV